MKWFAATLPLFLLLPGAVRAQSTGPSVDKGTLTFTHTVNDTVMPVSQTVKVTLPAALVSLPLVVTTPNNWLTIDKLTGYSPLTLTVSVNPTGLPPGSYPTSFSIDTNPARMSVTVNVTLVVQNPKPVLQLTSPTRYPYYTAPASGSTSPIVNFTYTTGQGATTDPAPLVPPSCSMELDVSSTGGIIPFTVTTSIAKGSAATANWVRVNGNGQLPTLQTSGVANTGSYAPICVTVDLPTIAAFDDGPYVAQIDIKAANPINGAYSVIVNLAISAGPPLVASLYPTSLPANPSVDPVFNIYGYNFFKSSMVKFSQGTNSVTVKPTFINRTTLQVSLDKSHFTPAYEGASYPIAQPGVPAGIPWTLEVYNTVPATNPTQAPSAKPFYVTDPSLPVITSVVNAASYQSTSVFMGTGTNPNPPGNASPTTVAPREIISIFGQNLGATSSVTATAVNAAGNKIPPPVYYPTSMTVTGASSSVTIGVYFMFTPPTGSSVAPPIAAPLVMVSNNQINAIVPWEVSEVLKTANHTVDISVSVTTTAGGIATTTITPSLTVTVMAEDPGIFTFSGLGSGQAAVQNQDYTINGTSSAKRSSVIQIFATGFGELATTDPMENGLVVTSAIPVKNSTVRVEMSGQPSVVTYAGTSPGSVAGLVQINAVVPPGAGTDCKVPITAWIGDLPSAHKSQGSVTICVTAK
jgi:uncharacterized protein (TIGR03437 family)